MKRPSPSLTREYFGMVFYFFADPGEIRQALIQTVMDYMEIPDLSFTRISEDGEWYKPFRGDHRDYVPTFFVEADFTYSHFFRLTNGSRTELHTHRVEFWGRKIHEGNPGKTPNYIYVEFPIDYDVDFHWHLFTQAYLSHDYFLGLGNPVITGQLESHPRSGAEAARALRASTGPQVGFWEVFGNLAYWQEIERREGFLYGPAQFIALGPELCPRVPLDDALEAAGKGEKENSHFTFFPDEKSYLFRADNDRSRRIVWELLSPLKATIKRPWKYWKDDQWDQWYGRVSMKEGLR